MIMKKTFIFAIILSLLFICGGVHGQSDSDKASDKDRDKDIPKFVPAPERPHQEMIDDDLSMARQLMSRGAFISAANFLEDIYAKDPSRREAVNLLLNCYMELKAFSKAELLLTRILEQYPFEYQYHNDLLNLYLKTGVDSSITTQIENILDKFPGNSDIYRDIISRLITYGFNDKALEMIESGRRLFDNRTLFSLERAALFENRGEYSEAVFEYYSAVNSDTLVRPQADRKLSVLIRYPGAVDDVIAALRSILDSLPDDQYALKVLQEAYVRSDRYEAAFETSVRLDSLTSGSGRELYRYLRNCHQRKLSEQVIKMAEYINAKDSVGPEISQYRFYYAEALLDVGRSGEAIDMYREIIQTYPMMRDRAKATLAIANAYRYNMRFYDSARVYFDSAAYFYKFTPVRFAARLETARLHLILGQLDSAGTVFSELYVEGDMEERRELIAYNLAMIWFYKKEFDNADIAFRKIINEFPRGYYINDALINSLIIREAQQSYPDALGLYSGAMLYTARMMPDSVEKTYRDIINMGRTSLTGLTMLRLAEHYRQYDDISGALDIIETMAADYAEDYFYPYTLKLKGEILSDDPARLDEAADIYRDLLQNYSGYPFTGEIREALQDVETSRPAS